ncbi:MAG: putative Zn-dependent hydrolase [Microgenomates group bacterium Gr01-1014_80]|nr:MAG: putative Zn-dependent hydrolase [Microgenomates group bacterium Gr01-1014_80]
MKITKFVHSCLLLEEAGKKVLIDPGNYSAEVLDLNSLSGLSYLLITHEHQDHMHAPIIKKIYAKFPGLKVISNQSVAGILEKEGIPVDTSGDDFVHVEEIPHEKIFMGPPPANTLFTVGGKLTHPGDSHHFESTTEILALPVQAPWGSTTDAVNLAVRLKPKVIIPIHDWHWNEAARENMYQRLEEYFENLRIKFIGLQTAVEYEL